MRKTIMIALITIMTVIGVAFYAGASDQKDPKVLFEDACSRCHSLDIPRGEKLTKASWQDIVRRMVSNGLDISDQAAAVIVEYLAALYKK